jgi:hypothetical protein
MQNGEGSMTDDEKKLDALKRSGRIDADAPADPAPDEEPAKPTGDGATSQPTGETSVDHPVDPAPPADPAPQPTEEPAKPDEGDEGDDEGGDGKPANGSEKKPRPERWIPVKKYTTEKSEWKTEREELLRKLAEAKGNPTNEAKPVTVTDAAKAFAEKNGFDAEDVQRLLDSTRGPATLPADVEEALREAKQSKAEREAAEQFAAEYAALEPQIRAQYPHASDAQLAAIRAHVDKLSHAAGLHDKDLDYVVFKCKADLDKLAPVPPAGKVPRRTAEPSRPGAGATGPVTADSLKDATDFSALDGLDPAQRSAVVRDLPPKAYARYVSWEGQRESGGGLVVQREGRKVVLK